MGGETDLGRMLESLAPVLSPETFVYCTVAWSRAQALGFQPACLIDEEEGVTVVCTMEQAEGAGLDFVFPCRRITLTVNSSLEAVGLTAAIAAKLSEAGISANVVAAYYHDQVFVPEARAEEAMAVLSRMGGGEAEPA